MDNIDTLRRKMEDLEACFEDEVDPKVYADTRRAFLAAYVTAHPLPSYEALSRRVAQRDFTVWAEMHETTHGPLEAVYRAGFCDQEKLRELGRTLFERGGHQSMAAHFYLILQDTPVSEDHYARGLVRTALNRAWDGVGTWRS
jgi:hypothetical protein